MKLAYVCMEYPPGIHGGIGTFLQTIAHAMTRAGHAVTVVVLGEQDAERDDDGVRVVTLAAKILQPGHIPYLAKLTDRIRLYRWLKREVAAGRVELIEVPECDGLLPFPFRACPVVVRLHLSMTAMVRDTGRRARLGIYLPEYLTLRVHRRWIGVSEHALRLTTATFGLRPAESATIYCPIDVAHPTAVLPSDLPDKFVLFAGLVGARKGAFAVAEAARLFLPRYPDLHVVYLGELDVENGVAADVRIRDIVGPALSSRVHCYGRLERADMLACMTRALAFTFPSRLETFGLVVGEAMLSGVPVVTSTCEPFPEYVSHEETGLLVPPDDPAALSASVCRLADSPEFARRLATAAHQAVSVRFSIETCLELSEQFYRQGFAHGRGDVSSSLGTRSQAGMPASTGDRPATPRKGAEYSG